MKAVECAPQLLEMIAGRHPQVLVRRSTVDHLQFAEEAAFDIGRDGPGVPVLDEEGLLPLIPELNDHPTPQARVTGPLHGTSFQADCAASAGPPAALTDGVRPRPRPVRARP